EGPTDFKYTFKDAATGSVIESQKLGGVHYVELAGVLWAVNEDSVKHTVSLLKKESMLEQSEPVTLVTKDLVTLEIVAGNPTVYSVSINSTNGQITMSDGTAEYRSLENGDTITIGSKIFKVAYNGTKFTFSEKIIGDIDADGDVDVDDKTLAESAYGEAVKMNAAGDALNYIEINGVKYNVIKAQDGTVTLTERLDSSMYMQTLRVGGQWYLVTYESVLDPNDQTRSVVRFTEFNGVDVSNNPIYVNHYDSDYINKNVRLGTTDYDVEVLENGKIIVKENNTANVVSIDASYTTEGVYMTVELGVNPIGQGQLISSAWKGSSLLVIKEHEFIVEEVTAGHFRFSPAGGLDYTTILINSGFIPETKAWDEALAAIQKTFANESYIWSDEATGTVRLDGITYSISKIAGGEIRLSGRDYTLDPTDSFGKTSMKVLVKNVGGGVLNFYIGGKVYTEDNDSTVVFDFTAGSIDCGVRYHIQKEATGEVKLIEAGSASSAVAKVVELYGTNYSWRYDTDQGAYIFSDGEHEYISTAMSVDGYGTVRIGEYIKATDEDISTMSDAEIAKIKGTEYDVKIDGFGDVTLAKHKEEISVAQTVKLGRKTYAISRREDGSLVFASYPSGIVAGTVKPGVVTVTIDGEEYDITESAGLYTLTKVGEPTKRSMAAFLVNVGLMGGRTYTVTETADVDHPYSFVYLDEEVSSYIEGGFQKVDLDGITYRIEAEAATHIPHLTEEYLDQDTAIGRFITIAGSDIVYTVDTVTDPLNIMLTYGDYTALISKTAKTALVTHINIISEINDIVEGDAWEPYTFKYKKAGATIDSTYIAYVDPEDLKCKVDIDGTIYFVNDDDFASDGILRLQREYNVIYDTTTVLFVLASGDQTDPNYDLAATNKNIININKTPYTVKKVADSFGNAIFEFDYIDLAGDEQRIFSNAEGIIRLANNSLYHVSENPDLTLHVTQVDYLTSQDIKAYATTNTSAAQVVNIGGVEYELAYETKREWYADWDNGKGVKGKWIWVPHFTLIKDGHVYENRNVPHGVKITTTDEEGKPTDHFFSFELNRFVIDLPEISVGVDDYPSVYANVIEVTNKDNGLVKTFYVKENMRDMGGESMYDYTYNLSSDGESYGSYIRYGAEYTSKTVDGDVTYTTQETGWQNVKLAWGDDIIDLKLKDITLEDAGDEQAAERLLAYAGQMSGIYSTHPFNVAIDRVAILNGSLGEVVPDSANDKYEVKFVSGKKIDTQLKEKVRFVSFENDWNTQTEKVDGGDILQKVELNGSTYNIIETTTGIMLTEEYYESENIGTNGEKRLLIGKRQPDGSVDTNSAYGLTYGARDDGRFEFSDGFNTFISESVNNTVTIYDRQYSIVVEGSIAEGSWSADLVELHSYSTQKFTGDSSIAINLTYPDREAEEYSVTETINGTYVITNKAATYSTESYKQAKVGSVYYDADYKPDGSMTITESSTAAEPIDYIGLLGEVGIDSLESAFEELYGLDPYETEYDDLTGSAGSSGLNLAKYDLVELFKMSYEGNMAEGYSSDWKKNFDQLLFYPRYVDYGYGSDSGKYSYNGIDFSEYMPKALAYVLQKEVEKVFGPNSNEDAGTFFIADKNKEYSIGNYMVSGLHANGKDYDLTTDEAGNYMLKERYDYTIGSYTTASILRYRFMDGADEYNIFSVYDDTYDLELLKSYMREYVTRTLGDDITGAFSTYSIDAIRSAGSDIRNISAASHGNFDYGSEAGYNREYFTFQDFSGLGTGQTYTYRIIKNPNDSGIEIIKEIDFDNVSTSTMLDSVTGNGQVIQIGGLNYNVKKVNNESPIPPLGHETYYMKFYYYEYDKDLGYNVQKFIESRHKTNGAYSTDPTAWEVEIGNAVYDLKRDAVTDSIALEELSQSSEPAIILGTAAEVDAWTAADYSTRTVTVIISKLKESVRKKMVLEPDYVPKYTGDYDTYHEFRKRYEIRTAGRTRLGLISTMGPGVIEMKTEYVNTVKLYNEEINKDIYYDTFKEADPQSEDVNGNEILDPGEDLNGNGALDSAETLYIAYDVVDPDDTAMDGEWPSDYTTVVIEKGQEYETLSGKNYKIIREY
ncbi:MAG: hypothetical protein WCT15_05030, partial [Candidatus Omnitrophota bacterium]